MKSTFKEYSATFGTLAINLVATVYAIFNPIVAKELFTLYGISTAVLYGHSQQQKLSDSRSIDEDRD
jgi:hypothetical protein